ncbi:MAG: B12-binding domain-containing radical SAM protein [Dehalococcoidales bacterium]|nr:B12-binding domain-containing radical SAM protein [Dehalococcoidales bacterium]
MKILLVYPQYPDTFWGFKHALKFISKKASFPPLGLLTVAAMLPAEWEKRLIDANVTVLKDDDIRWADYVYLSAMLVQQDSARVIISRCQALGTKVVAGGPLFTTGYAEFAGVDHFVLNEAEVTLPLFLADAQKGCARRVYSSDAKPDLSLTPVPQWSLVNIKNYASLNIQYSRGCPFNCEFCDIVLLNGREPRTKSKEKMLAEFDALYRRGWRGGVFVVDDNFIGNKNKLKTEILPALIAWMAEKKYPFALSTEASINLADDEELMKLMVDAGFATVFVGIETPNEESLAECAKVQNRNRDLVASVKKIQHCGLEVQGGFIVGFDNDPVSIFKNQVNFIQKSGIVTAMVGILNALPGTRLYQRLNGEHRLLKVDAGNNTDCSLNFVPKMKGETLVDGYKQILRTIYSPVRYYQRVKTFLREYKPVKRKAGRLQFQHIRAFLNSIWILGLREKGRRYYWKLFMFALFRCPRKFPIAISLAIYGYHFRMIAEKYTGGKISSRAPSIL